MTRKGFTLVELLAVIVILSIIVVIAVTKIGNVIEDAKKEAFKSTNKIIANQVGKLNGVELIPQTYTFTNGISNPDLQLSGEMPTNGTVEINANGDIQLATNNTKFCAIKRFYESEVAVYEVGNRLCNIIVEITLTVNPNGGTYEGSTSNTTYQVPTEDFQTVNNPTRDGYTFDGWTIEGEGTYSSWLFQAGFTDTTLIAKWKIWPTLTLNLNSGTTPQIFNERYSPYTDITLIKPTRTGYTFDEWTLSGTGSSIEGTTFTIGEENAILTANWVVTPILTVNANGGTWGGTTPQYVDSGTNVTVNIPTRTNYDFMGWTVSGTGSSINGTTFTMGTTNTTLTANWTLKSYTLTVNANGGTWGGTTPQTITIGGTSIMVNPTRSGYVFNGWTVSGTGSSISGTTFTMGTANTTLTANWLSYANMYNYNGSSIVIDDGSGNWRIKFLTSGTFTPLVNMVVDAFLVGGGGGGGGDYWSAGGGGGYTNNSKYIILTKNTAYSVIVGLGGGVNGNGGTTSIFGISATGGYPGTANIGSQTGEPGGNGGSGGGGYEYGSGGSDGSNGGTHTSLGGIGQGITTREFLEPSGDLYAGGGGAYRGNGGAGGGGRGVNGATPSSRSGIANTGGGGGGGDVGGSGIAIIRNTRISEVGNTIKYKFTYSGLYQTIGENTDNWSIKFLTNGTFTPLTNITIDVFLVGGGGGGGQRGYNGGGGGGGYTKTELNKLVYSGVGYVITIGTGGAIRTNGGTTSIATLGYSAAGGIASTEAPGGNGGSGGGGNSVSGIGASGGSNGSNGADGAQVGGAGQGTTTKEFGESTGTLYAGGGGGVSLTGPYSLGGAGGGGNGDLNSTGGGGSNGTPNTGGGGGFNHIGGSGIVIIRNHR